MRLKLRPAQKGRRVLPIEQTLSLIIKVCEAIQFAHEHGVLHQISSLGTSCFVKTANRSLLISAGEIKERRWLTFALFDRPCRWDAREHGARQTESQQGYVDETPMVAQHWHNSLSDAVRARQFRCSGNILEDAQSALKAEPIRPRAFNPHIHPNLEIITLKALRNAPAERYRSVAALEDDIVHYRRSEVISAKPVSTGRPHEKTCFA